MKDSWLFLTFAVIVLFTAYSFYIEGNNQAVREAERHCMTGSVLTINKIKYKCEVLKDGQ